MATTDKRSPWQDEFNVPDIADLRMDLPVPAAELFDIARDFLNERDGVVESLRWYGDCWFWAVVYFLPGRSLGKLNLFDPAPVSSSQIPKSPTKL